MVTPTYSGYEHSMNLEPAGDQSLPPVLNTRLILLPPRQVQGKGQPTVPQVGLCKGTKETKQRAAKERVCRFAQSSWELLFAHPSKAAW